MGSTVSLRSIVTLSLGATVFAACGSQASQFANTGSTGADDHAGTGGATTTMGGGEGGSLQLMGTGGAAGCSTDADCNDGDGCTEDACVGAGTKEAQLGTCTHTKIP